MPKRLLGLLLLCSIAGGASADTIKLSNGDTLNGEIVEWAIDHIILEHPQLGKIRIDLDQLDIDTGKPPSRGLFGTRFLRGWTRHYDLGWNGTNGDTDSINITTSLRMDYADEFTRWKFFTRYFYQKSTDGDADNNLRMDLRRDWLFPGHRWFAFGAARYQFDQFESWKHRTVFTVGPGFQILRGEPHSLDARLGATFTREWETDTSIGEALFAVDWSWAINGSMSITLSNEYYLQYKPDSGQFRNLTTGEWRWRLAEDPGLSLKFGGQNEYDSSAEAGDTKNDLRYYIALGLDF